MQPSSDQTKMRAVYHQKDKVKAYKEKMETFAERLKKSVSPRTLSETVTSGATSKHKSKSSGKAYANVARQAE
jgi:hypothetical protein